MGLLRLASRNWRYLVAVPQVPHHSASVLPHCKANSWTFCSRLFFERVSNSASCTESCHSWRMCQQGKRDARCTMLFSPSCFFPSVLGFWVKQCHVQTKRLASSHYSLCMVSTCPSVPKLWCWHVETSALHLDAALLCAALSRRQQKTSSEVQLWTWQGTFFHTVSDTCLCFALSSHLHRHMSSLSVLQFTLGVDEPLMRLILNALPSVQCPRWASEVPRFALLTVTSLTPQGPCLASTSRFPATFEPVVSFHIHNARVKKGFL